MKLKKWEPKYKKTKEKGLMYLRLFNHHTHHGISVSVSVSLCVVDKNGEKVNAGNILAFNKFKGITLASNIGENIPLKTDLEGRVLIGHSYSLGGFGFPSLR